MSNLNNSGKIIIGVLAAVVVGGGLGYAASKGSLGSLVSLGGSGKAVAHIQGKSFSMKDLEEEISHMPPQLQMALQDQEGKRRFLERLIDRELLLQEARRRGLEQSPEVKEKMAELQEKVKEFRQTLLLETLLTKELEEKVQVGDDELRAYLAARAQQIKVRHILVGTEAEARSLLERIQRGEIFERLAQMHSLDPGSKGRGGEMGFFSRGATVAAFEDAAFKLKPGEISGPVKTEYGYHLIKMVAYQQVPAQDLEKVREKARENLREDKQKQALKKLLEDLRAKYKVKINEEAFAQKPESKEPAPKAGAEKSKGR